MTEKSRTEYSARNTTIAVMSKVLAIVAGFASRVVFTHTLSQDYVGVNGLFTDIVNVLALSELGVGTAITYALYKPIAKKDVERQKSLMQMYRNFYRIVSLIVLVAGLLIIPFMGVLIKNQPQIDHLILIYVLYLLDSVVSYWLIYKRTLVDAHQLSYISTLYRTIALVLQNVLQIVILLFTENFILFVSIKIVCTLLGNLAISTKADRMFPYLKDRKVQKLPVSERKNIYQDIRAMLMHKIGGVIVNNTDNLLLSSLVGLVSASMYSNYYLLIGSVSQVLNQVFLGITASVGNLGVEETSERVKKIFEASFFVGQWMYGLATICIFEVIDLFVSISFGQQYVFSKDITLILCINFYLTGMRQATLVFRDNMGLFRYDRYKALAEAVINLVVSIFLGKQFGVIGIFLGTFISTLTTSFWVEPYMLYKHRLQTSVVSYFLHYGLYTAVTFLLWAVSDKVCNLVCGWILGSLWLEFVVRLFISVVIVNVAYLLIYHSMPEFQLIAEKAVNILRNRSSCPVRQERKRADKDK